MAKADPELLALLDGLPPEIIQTALSGMPPEALGPLLASLGSADVQIPDSPADQAVELDHRYLVRSHLRYLSDRLAAAIADVERGISRKLIVSMPPRHGKSQLCSIYMPVWILRKHPDWKIMLASHSPDLAASWGRDVRRIVEARPELGVAIAPDANAVTRWETTSGGVMRSLSVGQKPTGEGAKVMLIDDPVSGFAAAHSPMSRSALWDWWTADMRSRLEGATLVVVTMTRWHEDDIVGRLLSTEYPGDPNDWEEIVFPAIAAEHDALGRAPGEPLLSPLEPDDTTETALARFADIKAGMSSYQWSALYDQRPAPATGAIFDTGWWRFWTSNPARATPDGMVVYLDPERLSGGRCITSWDATFKDTASSDYVVGQRWARLGADRFLLDQARARLSFTGTISEMTAFAVDGLGAEHAHEHYIEDKANGPAIIDTLRDKIAGIKPVNPQGSKEARARAVTAEIESGNVYLPLPSDPGMAWVNELLEEARSFPTGRHDDQIDAMTQALAALRTSGGAHISTPTAGRSTGRGLPLAQRRMDRNLGAAARTALTRR